jgi:two-component system response regulator
VSSGSGNYRCEFFEEFLRLKDDGSSARVRKGEDTRSTPIVVLTSSQEEKDISECYKLGVNSYVVKPVEFDQFYKAIGDLATYWLFLNKSPL